MSPVFTYLRKKNEEIAVSKTLTIEKKNILHTH